MKGRGECIIEQPWRSRILVTRLGLTWHLNMEEENVPVGYRCHGPFIFNMIIFHNICWLLIPCRRMQAGCLCSCSGPSQTSPGTKLRPRLNERKKKKERKSFTTGEDLYPGLEKAWVQNVPDANGQESSPQTGAINATISRDDGSVEPVCVCATIINRVSVKWRWCPADINSK